MTTRLALALAASLGLAMPAYSQAAPTATAATAETSNPFSAESPLPLHYPQFDKIKDSDFAPAFDARHGRAAEGNRGDRQQPDGAHLRQHHPGDGEERPGAESRARPCSSAWSGPTPTMRATSCDADYVAEVRRAQRRHRPQPASCSRASRRSTTSATRWAWTPRACAWSIATTPISCAPARKLSDADKAKLKTMNAELAELGTQVQPERAEGRQRLGGGRRRRQATRRLHRRADRRRRRGGQDPQAGRQVRHHPAQHHRPAAANPS